MTCPKCKNVVSEDASFCMHCGTRIDSADFSDNKQTHSTAADSEEQEVQSSGPIVNPVLEDLPEEKAAADPVPTHADEPEAAFHGKKRGRKVLWVTLIIGICAAVIALFILRPWQRTGYLNQQDYTSFHITPQEFVDAYNRDMQAGGFDSWDITAQADGFYASEDGGVNAALLTNRSELAGFSLNLTGSSMTEFHSSAALRGIPLAAALQCTEEEAVQFTDGVFKADAEIGKVYTTSAYGVDLYYQKLSDDAETFLFCAQDAGIDPGAYLSSVPANPEKPQDISDSAVSSEVPESQTQEAAVQQSAAQNEEPASAVLSTADSFSLTPEQTKRFIAEVAGYLIGSYSYADDRGAASPPADVWVDPAQQDDAFWKLYFGAMCNTYTDEGPVLQEVVGYENNYGMVVYADKAKQYLQNAYGSLPLINWDSLTEPNTNFIVIGGSGEHGIGCFCIRQPSQIEVDESGIYTLRFSTIAFEMTTYNNYVLELQGVPTAESPYGMHITSFLVMPLGNDGSIISELVPDADSRLLTDDDLLEISQLGGIALGNGETSTKEALGYARNEIYAKHGNIFDNPKYAEYFSSRDWYVPTHKVTDETELNETERANIQTILAWEAQNS